MTTTSDKVRKHWLAFLANLLVKDDAKFYPDLNTLTMVFTLIPEADGKRLREELLALVENELTKLTVEVE